MIIEIKKLDLIEGEEVLDLGDKVMKALAQSKAKLKKSLRLIGVYNNHVITRDAETGRLFKMDISRDGSAVVLGSPEEVQQSFSTLKELKEQRSLKEAAEKERIAAEKAKAKKIMIETGEMDGHKHSADVDAEGNGKTNEVNGHSHEVAAFKVGEAGGHTHSLKKPEAGPPMDEEEGKEKQKKRDDSDTTPQYVKIEKASIWRGVL